MRKHDKHKKHIMKLGLIAAASLVWLIVRTGRKPSRIMYPCQRAAVANINLFLLALIAPLMNLGMLKLSLTRFVSSRTTKTILLVGSLLLAFETVEITGNYMSSSVTGAAVPLHLRSQSALVASGYSDLFFVENSSGFEGNMDSAVSRLFQLMQAHGLHFYKTTSQPSGLIGKDDVVIIKVNCQWTERGGTNTDLVKSLIQKIVNHPEGYVGEVVVADNGAERGSLDWPLSNAYDHTQSMQDVVNLFSSYKVSTWLWDTIASTTVNEYEEGSLADGYVINNTANPITHLHVSYPKFRTVFGTYVSFKKGIWNTSSYDSEKLKVINVPVLKSHSDFGVTGAVKHYMGVVSHPLTNAHMDIQYGGMGTEMIETRYPVLNIVDAIWVNANPLESWPDCGPASTYDMASYTNVIGASQDPVGLDYWTSKHILIPAAIEKGHTSYSSLDPDNPGGLFHNYLVNSMNVLKSAGHQVTLSEGEMNVYVSSAFGVINLNTGLSYSSIQQAIDAAETLTGHTVFAGSGAYYEHLAISKSLSLIGEGRDATIVDGGGSGTVISIQADAVNLTGLTVRGSGMSLGDSGFHIQASSANRISGNRISGNNIGLTISSSSSNIISDNIFQSNELALSFNAVSNSALFHNSFIDNTNQAYVDNSSGTAWDLGYPSGGNYWSTHIGSDSFIGSSQNMSGSDGIVDQPYVVYGSDVDNYPLTSPSEYWSAPIPGDVNRDTRVNMDDVIQLCDGFGSINQSDGYYWHNPPRSLCPHFRNLDLDGNGIINMGDIMTGVEHFGDQYP